MQKWQSLPCISLCICTSYIIYADGAGDLTSTFSFSLSLSVCVSLCPQLPANKQYSDMCKCLISNRAFGWKGTSLSVNLHISTGFKYGFNSFEYDFRLHWIHTSVHAICESIYIVCMYVIVLAHVTLIWLMSLSFANSICLQFEPRSSSKLNNKDADHISQIYHHNIIIVYDMLCV